MLLSLFCNCCIFLNIAIFFVPLALSLSLSLCAYLRLSSIRRFFFTIECCVIFRIDGLSSATIGIRALVVLHPAVGRHSNIWNTTFCFCLHLKKQRRKKKKNEFASHCVKSLLGVSQPVVLCFFVIVTAQGGTSYATRTRLCFIRLNGI